MRREKRGLLAEAITNVQKGILVAVGSACLMLNSCSAQIVHNRYQSTLHVSKDHDFRHSC